MAITYSNRKGQKYYLSAGTTKTGKIRYNFSLEPKGTPVEEVPDGYHVQETVNGIVSLVKTTACPLFSEDIATLESAIRANPRASRYRMFVKGKEITIHERIGSNLAEIAKGFGLFVSRSQVEEYEAANAQYQPVMRFILVNEEKRLFAVERWCFRGSIDDWIGISYNRTMKRLAAKYVPLLGTDDIYELY